MKKAVLLILIGLVTGGNLMAEEMSATQWMQYNDEYAVWAQSLIDSIHNGEARPIKCATPIINALNSSRPKGVESKVLYTDREDSMSFTYATAHFLLHYTNNGANAIFQYSAQDSLTGVPNYIFNAGRICDSVWEHTVGQLGFTAPVSDGYYNGGGDGRLDIYFIDFQAYGATVIDRLQNTSPQTATTYMFLENDYEGFPGYDNDRLNAIRVTMAHEFFHSVQFAIDAGEVEGTYPDYNSSWIEMSATYMEEEHYPQINDYLNYLPYFYHVPQWSIWTGSTLGSPTINLWRNFHMYASVIWPIYLSQRFGSGIIKAIWDICGTQAGPNWRSAAVQAVSNISGGTTTLADEFQEFTVWNLLTKNRTRPGYFPDAADFDTVYLASRVSTYPTTVTPNDSIQPDNLGANYIMLENTASMPGLVVAFTADTLQPWGITIVGLHNNINTPISVAKYVHDSAMTVIRILDASSYDKIAVIPAVLGGNSTSVNYSLTVGAAGEGVLQPNGGEVLNSGFTYDISWYLPDAGATVLIEFSSDNGQTWSDIATTENDLSYLWTIPDIASDSCLIRITGVSNPGISDVSDGVFSISAASEMIWDPFPNPAWPDKHDAIRFKATYQQSPSDVEPMQITIMTLSGEKVKELEGVPSAGSVIVAWDFTNDDGRTVAAGPYLAVIKFLGETTIKKFVVLR